MLSKIGIKHNCDSKHKLRALFQHNTFTITKEYNIIACKKCRSMQNNKKMVNKSDLKK